MSSEHYQSPCLSEELSSAALGDKRLTRRLQQMAASASANPTESFPKMFGSGAGVEAGYRFFRNARVTFDKVLEPHIEQSSQRALLEKEVLVLHDTSEFRFSSKRAGLGFVGGSASAGDGFFGHFSLAVSSTSLRPLGVLAAELTIKPKKKGYQSPSKKRQDPTRKTLCWGRGIRASEKRLGSSVSAIHVADREADFYELLSELDESGSRYVIRVCRDRLVKADKAHTLYTLLEKCQVELQREVQLSERKTKALPRSNKINTPRKSRLATLCVSAARVELVRGHYHGARLKKTILANVVHVFESNPPSGQQPIDWKLYTTQSIDTAEDIAKVVDIYRARWLIEEYFKALKSGCALHSRQLESKQTLLNALAVFVPIAWRMLLLRSQANFNPDAPATEALTPVQLQVLRAVSTIAISESPSIHEALMAVARLGGHLKQNGPPGWQLLAKGLTELLTIEKGWLAFQKRCDQS